MLLALPAPLATFVETYNAHDLDAFADCFAEDAVVRDEGRMHVGRPAIRAWFEEVTRRYRMTVEVTDLVTQDGEPVLCAVVTGDFVGSPLEMRFYLGLEDDKIVALRIAG